MFITFEGGEGAGKTTQMRLLAERLAAVGRVARLTREPGGTPLADGIRTLILHPDESLQVMADAGMTAASETMDPMLPITQVLLYSASRAQHTALIREWLAAGEIVVCDRYADSTRVYQGAAGGVSEEDILAAERLATGGLKPDLTLLFDLPVEVGLARRQADSAAGGELNWLDVESDAFHERVRAGYLALAAASPERWVVVDATAPAEELAERVWQVLSERLAGTPHE